MSTGRLPIRLAVAAAVALALTPVAALADDRDHRHHGERAGLDIRLLGSLNTGGAEISAFDRDSRRLFVTDAIGKRVIIVDASNPSNLVPAGVIDVSAAGSPNSVAVGRGMVAVAIQDGTDKTKPGVVNFYTTRGDFIAGVPVGALPDMLTFTPDQKHVLVANEGEPNTYLVAGQDPEGSVSIISIQGDHSNDRHGRKPPQFQVRSVDFKAYIGQEAALRAQGIRIYGPNANAAQDFEPEYIGVSEDSRTAFVTLQENNAVAKIDIASGKVVSLLPLGYKDYSAAPQVNATYVWEADQLPSIGTTPAGQTLRLGGFSGLFFEGREADGTLKFIANTDRGPNGEPTSTGLRPFLLPGFSPRLVRFTLDPDSGKLRITQQLLLRRADGTPLTGLPNTAIPGGTASTAHNDEVPIDLYGNVLPLDQLGGDFEGIVVAADGTFWLPDEYRPALYHFDAQGRLLERFIPEGAHAAAGLPVPAAGTAGALGIEALPGVLAQRRQNRGMEALALRDGKLYAFVQSPLRNPVATGNSALNSRQNIRVVEFDPATRATRQFLYIMDNEADAAGTRADKLGDAVATPEGFLVVERDDDAVPASDLAVIRKRVYAFSLAWATPITPANDILYAGKTLDAMTSAELTTAGIAPLAKTLDVDLAQAGYAGVQKVEGLALLDDGRLAVINDNDFQVASIVIDNAAGTFTPGAGYVPESTVIGIIDRPGLDGSDRDGPGNSGRINIRPWPVFGMYQPDAIDTYRVRGRTYFVTANEGDARADWPGLNEESRISSGSIVLDPVAFPNAALLKNDDGIGRLNVTNKMGDTDGDGDYDQLYTLGGRSFSIWSSDGTQVYDSGSALERITSIALPARFNAGHDDPAFDNRSDNKGPEPEGLAIGRIGANTYAFVGLERIGGIATFDISSPYAPQFINYTNSRSFGTPETGDLGPEGVLFVPAEDSPTHEPLLFVTSEVSNTVSAYSLQKKGRD
jgi:hypothetical protein